MALNFPDTPTLGQVFSSEDISWQWDGTRWVHIVAPLVPRGLVGTGTLPANQLGITTMPTDLNGMSVPWVAGTNRKYKITVEMYALSSVAGDWIQARIVDVAGVQLHSDQRPATTADAAIKLHAEVVISPPAGNYLAKVQLVRVTGTGTLRALAGTTVPVAPSFIMVEDITFADVSSAGGGGSSSGSGGSGFTFVTDTKPNPFRAGDTWFDTNTLATGGSSWVAIEESAGGEKVWVQFAPGTAAGVVSPFPAGSIIDFIGTTAPSGWIAMIGQAITNADTTYPNLWAVPGIPGKSGTTLTLPDTRGRVAVGYNVSDASFNTIGLSGGAKTHTLAANELPAHTHPIVLGGTLGQTYKQLITDYAAGGGNIAAIPTSVSGISNVSGAAFADNNTGGGLAHNNLQPYTTFLKIVRAY